MSEVFTTNLNINYTDQDTGSVNRIINSLKTLSPEDFIYSKIKLEIGGETDPLEILLCEDQDFVYFESDKPVNYIINSDGNIISDTTLFLHYGHKIDLYLSNPSATEEVIVKYVTMAF